MKPSTHLDAIVGSRFGRLTVVSRHAQNTPAGSKRWHCRCDCGGRTVTTTIHLTSGHTQSCGCLRRDRTLQTIITHGLTGSVEHVIWQAMKQRCQNPRNKAFKYYGGRGISVCPRWVKSFPDFLADMGRRPSPKHSIDRVDVNGNYEPENCRWATITEQRLNTRRGLEKRGLL